MANNTANVTAAKPAVGGAIYIAPITATLPTSASATLGSDFKSLGYVSDAGMTNSNQPSVSNIKEWGGQNILSITSEKPDTFKFTLVEALNIEVLKMVYGDANVTGTLATGITINAKNFDYADKAFVCDMILKDGTLKRVVIPCATVTAVDDITYSASAAVGYGTTITAKPDASGNTHYEYIVSAQSNG